MTIPVTITLNSIVGTPGPFDLYSNADGFSTAFDTNIPLSTLISGYGASAPDGSTTIRVQSTGGCNTSQDFLIQNLPATPTPTQTLTPTNTATYTPTPTITVTPTITPTTSINVSCYTLYNNSYTTGPCGDDPSSYENYQTIRVDFSENPNVDVRIQGSYYLGSTISFDYTIPANTTNSYTIFDGTCGCDTSTYGSDCPTSLTFTVTAFDGALTISNCGSSSTPTPTPTPTPKAPYFGIIRTSAPSGPSDCSIGGISIGGSQGVWEFQSTTNSIGADAVFTDYPGTTYNTLSQFNLQIGTTYYLCDLSYGWTSFIYYGDNTVICNTVNGCPVSYEFAVYTGTSEQVCHFFNEATGYTYGAHQYFVQNGFLIITTVNDNNVLNDGFNPYYSVGSNPPAVIDGDNSTFWIGEDGNYGTFDSEGNFSLFGSCGGNIV